MKSMHRICRAAPPGLFLAAVAASDAFAQVGGNADPNTVGRAILTVFLGILAIAAIGYWGAVGAACYRGQIATHWIWGGAVGTLLIACCGYIASRALGGGGGTFSL
jgi:hypothetical protein